jgi:hypothetical protein
MARKENVVLDFLDLLRWCRHADFMVRLYGGNGDEVQTWTREKLTKLRIALENTHAAQDYAEAAERAFMAEQARSIDYKQRFESLEARAEKAEAVLRRIASWTVYPGDVAPHLGMARTARDYFEIEPAEAKGGDDGG